MHTTLPRFNKMDLETDKKFQEAIHILKSQYGCHTTILYGSRARNECNEKSDYDLIGIRESGKFERDCRFLDGNFLDMFIYSEKEITNPTDSLLRIKDGIIIFEKNSIGTNLINAIHKIYENGAPKTPEWEKHEIQNWLSKMLDRASVGDIEGNFRRSWLLHEALECYFKLNDMWYLGPKESFKWIRQNKPKLYIEFENALNPNSDLVKIKSLIDAILY